MIIVYISKLKGYKSHGPTYSVPAQIKAQSEYDQVYWINLMDDAEFAFEKMGINGINHEEIKIKDLPIPYNKPDLLVFESFYELSFLPYVLYANRNRIPYVIVPRSSMTNGGQKVKRIKKKIGNLIWFSRFAKNATSVQFLTETEKKESATFYSGESFVEPNGINVKHNTILEHNENDYSFVRCTYIGRICLNQKGLERMIEAIRLVQDDIRNNNIRFDLYGESSDGAKQSLEELITKYFLQDIVAIHMPVYDAEKEEILKRTDVFIMTSFFEGLPMSMLDALSYGIPCIATEGTNMADILVQENAGWSAGSNIDDIASAIQKMILEKGNFQIMRENAMRLALQYDWGKIAKDTHSIYIKIVNGL